MDLREGIISAAQELGISPYDLATVISYETGGTFDPLKRGPTTKWGQHRGLIQFGEPQARQYGVNWDDPMGSQLGPQGAVVKYLRGSGLKPGMNLLDLYSAINAGAPGLYNRSDTAAGGAPGTVRDKVEQQMEGHKRKAAALLGGEYTPTYTASQPRISTQGAAPMDAQQAPQQRGLLGLFGSGEDDPRSPAERRRDILANLAIGLSGMSMFPNTGMINALQGGVEERREARKEAAAAEKALQSKSRTVEWLRSPGVGRPDLAAAVASGALDGRSAASLAFQQPKDDRTALMKNYEYARQTGYTGSFSDFLRQGGGGGSVVNVGGEVGKIVGDQIMVPDPNSELGVRFIPIPGGKTALAAEEEATRRQAAARQDTQKESVVAGSIDYLLGALDEGGLFNLPEAGIVGNVLGNLGVNQEAVDFRNELATVQSNIAFDRLQQMREASTTGGALGAVTERELDLLINAYGNLQQSTSPERLRANLEAIKRIMTKIENDPVASSYYYGQTAPGQAASGGGFSVTGKVGD